MSLPPDGASSLEPAVWSRLEAIVDPCSRATGAPAGLVSMGLVGGVEILDHPAGAEIRVTLYITEPGCMMGALFALTAERELRELPGVQAVHVSVDYGHVWTPDQMTPEYRQRLAELRQRRRREMAVTGPLRPSQ